MPFLAVIWHRSLVGQRQLVLKSWTSLKSHFTVRSLKDTAWPRIAQLAAVPGLWTHHQLVPSALRSLPTRSSWSMYPQWAIAQKINPTLVGSFASVDGTVLVNITRVRVDWIEIPGPVAESLTVGRWEEHEGDSWRGRVGTYWWYCGDRSMRSRQDRRSC